MARNTARTATTPRSTRSTALSTPRARSPKPDDGSRLAPGSNPRRNGEPPKGREDTMTRLYVGAGLSRTAVYGLPLNPRHLLEELAGASFCVSFATRDKLGPQLDDAIRLVGDDGILLIDNGAFSLHKRGISTRTEDYQIAYEAWAQDILDRCPQAVAILPDIIDGNVEENWRLVCESSLDYERCMPVWQRTDQLPTAYVRRLLRLRGYR